MTPFWKLSCGSSQNNSVPQSSFLVDDGVGAAGSWSWLPLASRDAGWDGPGKDTELGNPSGEEQEGAGSREEARGYSCAGGKDSEEVA